MAAAPEQPVLETTTKPWSYLQYEGLCISTPNWDICTTIMLPSLHARLPMALELSLAKLLDTLDPEAAFMPDPPHRLTMCLLSDRRQWTNLTRMLLPEHAESMQGLSRGGFTARGVAMLYDIDYRDHYRDTIALAMHEGWHQYVQTALLAPLPAWLDEGLATLMEGYRLLPDEIEIDHKANRQRQRRAWWMYRRGRMQPLDIFIADAPHDAMDRGRHALLDYYGQAWAFTRFMLETPDNFPQVRRIVAAAAEGRHCPPIKITPELQAEFDAWCEDTLTPSWWR
ncbi:MAG: hypothetical protein MK100_04765 [Phycisphaerales bacterium]|nr:hypothetical protein [Phycisphaerales bacterium]